MQTYSTGHRLWLSSENIRFSAFGTPPKGSAMFHPYMGSSFDAGIENLTYCADLEPGRCSRRQCCSIISMQQCTTERRCLGKHSLLLTLIHYKQLFAWATIWPGKLLETASKSPYGPFGAMPACASAFISVSILLNADALHRDARKSISIRQCIIVNIVSRLSNVNALECIAPMGASRGLDHKASTGYDPKGP